VLVLSSITKSSKLEKFVKLRITAPESSSECEDARGLAKTKALSGYFSIIS
jgi:hypothetical protein